jgi:hypothetical protein
MSDIRFFPFCRRMPYIREMLELRKGYMKFTGYFHEEEAYLPVERLIHVGSKTHLIRIDSKKQYNINTSGSFFDEGVGGEICLFPSYTIEITFTPIKADLSPEEFHTAMQDIKADDDLVDQRMQEKWDKEYETRLAAGSKSPIHAEGKSETR